MTETDQRTPDIPTLVDAVKRHATAHYENGWDVVIECMTDDDIAAHLEPGMTIEDAIKRVAEREYLRAYVDRRNDALAVGGLETTRFDMGLTPGLPSGGE